MKNNEDAYSNLFNAIWKQAVSDDIAEVRKKLTNYGFIKAYKVYEKNVDEPLPPDAKEFKNIKKDIKDYSKIKSRDIEKRIKELVYKEAKNWPHSKRYKWQDEEYQQTLKELRAEVKQFSEERMAKRWMRI